MMESFNIDRFGKTLRWVMAVNFRTLLMWTIGFFAGVFLAEMTIFTFADSTESAQDSVLSFEIPFIMIGVLACLSSIMSDVNKKTRRTAFLMLPASNLEKYLSLVFYVTVVWVAYVVLSLIAGDMLRMAVRALCFGDEWISTIPLLLDALMPYSLKRLWMPEIVFMVLMLIFIHSLYILGGTWLRKYAFVVSSLVLIAMPVMIQYLCVEPGGHLNLFVIYDGVRHVNPLSYVLDVMFVILAAFNYWASFHIFKHFELITNKWTNYDILKR